MNRRLLILALMLLTGCARFQSKPISPNETGSQLDARRLDDSELKTFLENNLGREFESWPPNEWDFQSLTLTALYFHPSLDVARAQWHLTEAGIKTAGGRPNPTLSLTPGYNTTTLVPLPWFPGLNFDLPLETAGKRDKRISEAQQLSTSARWNFVTTAWQVRSNVRTSLLDFTVATRHIGTLELQISAQEQIIKLLQQRFDAGVISRPELTTAKIALHKTQLDLAAAKSRRAEALPRLAESLGLTATALDSVDFSFEFPPPPDDLSSTEARRLALQSRSDILAALADYAATEDNLRQQIAKQFPDIHLNPGYQFDQGDNKWSLGITLELPILNQNQGPIAEAEARRKLAATKFTALQAQVIGEIDRALGVWRVTREQRKTADALLAAAQQQQQSVLTQKQSGVADPLDLLSSSLELNTVSLLQLENEAQFQRTVGALEDALQRPVELRTALLALPSEKSRP